MSKNRTNEVLECVSCGEEEQRCACGIEARDTDADEWDDDLEEEYDEFDELDSIDARSDLDYNEEEYDDEN